MNKQRKVLITTTYNEMGVIVDIKAEEVAQPNLQPTCNQLTTDTISRQAAIDALDCINGVEEVLRSLPTAQPGYRIDEWCHDCKEYDQEHHCCPRFNRVIREALKEVQPEPKEGYWIPRECIDGDIQYECSKCGVLWEFNDGTPEDNEAYFCPKCGTKLKGERPK